MVDPDWLRENDRPRYYKFLARTLQAVVEFRNTDSEVRQLMETMMILVEEKAWEHYPIDEEKKRPLVGSFAEYVEFITKIPYVDLIRHIDAFVWKQDRDKFQILQAYADAELVNRGGNNNPSGRNQHKKEEVKLDDVKVDQKETVKFGGNGAPYLLRRLARDHAEILDRYEAGEFPSVRQAAIAAGITKVPTPLEAAIKAVDKLDDEDRAKLITHLTT